MSDTERPISEEHEKAAMDFAMQMLAQMPKGDPAATEAHLVSVLIVFWGALWGTMGTEYAEGFITAQLNGMAPGVPHDVFRPPPTH